MQELEMYSTWYLHDHSVVLQWHLVHDAIGLHFQRVPAGIVGARISRVPVGVRIPYICGRGQSRTEFDEICGRGRGHGHKFAGVGVGVVKDLVRIQPTMPAWCPQFKILGET